MAYQSKISKRRECFIITLTTVSLAVFAKSSVSDILTTSLRTSFSSNCLLSVRGCRGDRAERRGNSHVSFLRVKETQVKPVKLRTKEKDRYLSVFISKTFRNAASGSLNNAVKPLYVFLSLLSPLFLSASLCVLASLSQLEADPLYLAEKYFLESPGLYFFGLAVTDSDWLHLSHMIFCDPITVHQGMWCCD